MFDGMFLTSKLRSCSYYKESHKILGQTFGFLVLQDYEAITPNLLARTIETVEGGGVVCLLLKNMSSLKQLYTMSMVSIDRRVISDNHKLIDEFTLLFRRTSTRGIERRTTLQCNPDSTSVSSCH